MNPIREIKRLFEALFPIGVSQKYSYLGYTHIPYRPLTYPHEVMVNVIEAIDRRAKPKWCPRWVLRILQLYGNDNSVVRVRYRKLSNLHKKLTQGIFITDIKTKWGPSDIRIYGQFNDEIDGIIELAEEYIYQYYKNEKESN
jgi:hypothetical protein